MKGRRGARWRTLCALGGVAAACGVTCGCELVLGLGDLSEKGRADSGPVDATALPDASGVADASSDTGTDAAASPCVVADAHTFCEDFDEVDTAAALSARWSSVTAGVGASLIVADAALVPPVSPPNSLGLEVDPLDGGTVEVYLLDTLSAPTVSGVTCDMMLWIDHVDPGASTYILGAAVRGGGVDPVSLSGVNLSLDPNLHFGLTSFAQYVDGGNGGTTVALGAGVYRQWIHVTLRVAQPDAGASNAAASVTFQNGTTGSGSLAVDVPATGIAALLTIGYTLGTRSTSSGWLYYVDDFYCDVAP